MLHGLFMIYFYIYMKNVYRFSLYYKVLIIHGSIVLYVWV